jgi:hypothetical protein
MLSNALVPFDFDFDLTDFEIDESIDSHSTGNWTLEPIKTHLSLLIRLPPPNVQLIVSRLREGVSAITLMLTEASETSAKKTNCRGSLSGYQLEMRTSRR